MAGFKPRFEPIAEPGQGVRLLPDDTVFRVRSLEPLGRIGPVDFGSISAQGNASQGGNELIEVTELEVNQHVLGHYRVFPLEPVEIEMNQDQRQEVRMSTGDQRGVIAPDVPDQLREIYVHGDGVPYFRVRNPNQYDLNRSRVAFFGIKYLLTDSTVATEQVDGEPRAVPVDKLEQRTQGQGGGPTASTRRAD